MGAAPAFAEPIHLCLTCGPVEQPIPVVCPPPSVKDDNDVCRWPLAPGWPVVDGSPTFATASEASAPPASSSQHGGRSAHVLHYEPTQGVWIAEWKAHAEPGDKLI